MTGPDLLRSAIAASGVSARRFAEDVMGRDERTLRRWSSGEVEIPPLALRWLQRLHAVRETRTRLHIELRAE